MRYRSLCIQLVLITLLSDIRLLPIIDGIDDDHNTSYTFVRVSYRWVTCMFNSHICMCYWIYVVVYCNYLANVWGNLHVHIWLSQYNYMVLVTNIFQDRICRWIVRLGSRVLKRCRVVSILQWLLSLFYIWLQSLYTTMNAILTSTG
jgi:hypothetical protein